MKTALPDAILTIEQAQEFLKELHSNGEHFHPEDDAYDINFNENGIDATLNERKQLNKLMDDIYNLPGNDGRHDDGIAFCPCGFLLDLDPEYVEARDKDAEEYFDMLFEQEAEERLYK